MILLVRIFVLVFTIKNLTVPTTIDRWSKVPKCLYKNTLHMQILETT